MPQAGLTFAIAMMLGVGLTLAAVAVLVVSTREQAELFITRHGGSVEKTARALEAFTGVLLIAIGLRELIR